MLKICEDRVTTILNGLKEGFTTYLITDATRAVNMEEDDFDKALKRLQEEGAKLIAAEEV